MAQYLEKHPDEMYDVLNDILSLLDTHSMYLSSEEYSQGFSTLEALSASVSACRRQKTAYRLLRSCAIQRQRKPVCRLAILS